MHLLQAQQGEISDGTEPVDPGQAPADLVVISANDAELAALAAARARLGDAAPSLRLARLGWLQHPYSVDLYLDATLTRSKLVVARLLGGEAYWPYGLEQCSARLGEAGVPFAALPGDDRPDEALDRASTVSAEDRRALWAYLAEGGPENTENFLRLAAHLLGRGERPPEAAPLLRAGVYHEGRAADLDRLRASWEPGRPVGALVFYRALLQGAGLDPVDRLIDALREEGLNPLPIFAASLKDAVSAATLEAILAEAPPDIVLNATSFAVGAPDAKGARKPTPLDGPGVPVLQVVFSGGAEAEWAAGDRGLSARDIAMNVALPEVDGRILSRAVSFKGEIAHDAATQCPILGYRARPDRIAFAAKLAASWARLRRAAPAERHVGLILANYPNKDGRLANGVGLDTPEACAVVLAAMREAGYAVADAPADGAALMALLTAGPTNAREARSPRRLSNPDVAVSEMRAAPGRGGAQSRPPGGAVGRGPAVPPGEEEPQRAFIDPDLAPSRTGGETLSLAAYRAAFARLPQAVRDAVTERWGAPEADPFVEGDSFRLALHRFGNVVVGIQPARGYNIDPTETYHSPDLVPPHGYLAFYLWLREAWGAHALVHLGKHGNLEWLPGKAVALSETCFPEAVFGPLPHLYPFIVNDPGEGTQAKRRAQAVIVDHLTPPLTRAETYGPLRDLEALVDEYYEAAGVDARRLGILRRDILELTESAGLDVDAGMTEEDDADSRLRKLDAYLCELKESQIRDGLHIFGRAPEGRLETDLLAALARLPRGEDKGGSASLIRALARDLGLTAPAGEARARPPEPDGRGPAEAAGGEGGDARAFDPLDCDMAAPWAGPRPALLAEINADPWRTAGDTVERLELLAATLIAPGGSDGFPMEVRCKSDTSPIPAHVASMPQTGAVLSAIETGLRPALRASGPAEIAGLLNGLAGRFVPPGPSGAPTRGRPDVLPTGRNFFSVDSRAIPTPTAWTLGWKSASRLIERHAQEHGDWPRAIALTAWGTANMRTGGDDLAQALALMGCRPTWDAASRRVTGFEILPLSVLGRPRVDVTLRVSGFFRDAFPAQIDLIDSAARAVMALDEPDSDNPAAARFRSETARLAAEGAPDAARRAGFRVFGSKPGAYGAGLQAMIDERLWERREDLAGAFLTWGGYAYGDGAEGAPARDALETRLASVEAVVQNQDNREHDLLDSDDYYQFEGGMAATVETLRGEAPTVYHNDHSRPERPVIRTLSEEVGRVVRSRVVNPKWIAGCKRHGYKGAFEMAATVDYLFAFAATTHAVRDHHFDLVHAAYLEDDETRAFLAEANPAALREMAQRLAEAVERGLWRPRSNSAGALLDRLSGGAHD